MDDKIKQLKELWVKAPLEESKEPYVAYRVAQETDAMVDSIRRMAHYMACKEWEDYLNQLKKDRI